MKVLLVDDHPVFRRGIREILGERAEITRIDEAGDAESAMAHMRISQPDLGLFDLALPGMDGLELVAWTHREMPGTACVVLTMYGERAYLDRALELGVHGYLLKDDTETELRLCLDTLAEGEPYVSPRFGRRREPAPPPRDPELAVRLDALTPAQRRVLDCVARFMTSREIAAELGMSHRTVQNHRANIVRELGLSGPNQLLRFAAENAPPAP